MTDDRAAVLIPGARGGQASVWMWFAKAAAEARGAVPHPIEWRSSPAGLGEPDDPQSAAGRSAFVRQHVEPVLERVETGVRPVVIGKSLGSTAAPVTAERGLPAVWLTPLLIQADVVAALRAATQPFLLVGGTADWAWDGGLARELTPYVCEIERADHGFRRPGEPLAATAAVLADMGTAMEEFLDTVVWPG